MTLVEFHGARLAEDELIAGAAIEGKPGEPGPQLRRRSTRRNDHRLTIGMR